MSNWECNESPADRHHNHHWPTGCMNCTTSDAERVFITRGVEENVRGDGREKFDFRQVSIEDQVLPHLHGSSKVTIGNNDVLCSVKLSVDEPVVGALNSGVLDVCIDVSQHTNVRMDERNLHELGSNLAEVLKSVLIESDSLELEDLCIIPGKFCWVMHLDILVLRYDGSILDAASIAALNALKVTKVPKVHRLIGESGMEEDFEISGDLEEAVSIECARIPICITVAKIGDCLVLDPTSAELACASGLLVVAIDREQTCCGMHKLLGGTFSIEDIAYAVQIAAEAAAEIHSQIDVIFAESEKSLYPELPPQRIGLLA